MFRTYTTLLLIVAFVFGAGSTNSGVSPITDSLDCRKLYHEMNLENIVNYKAFEQAMEGYFSLDVQRKDVLTLIDYSKPSTEPRMFVINVREKKLLFATVVAHGRNSGDNYATSFSNKDGSLKSSLGFFVTENTYRGKNGYSLVLNGLEKGINDRAKQRSIVIHGAKYCNPSVISSGGRLGRSWGCPAIPTSINNSIIDTIKGGSLLYIYADNKQYLAQSPVLLTASRSM